MSMLRTILLVLPILGVFGIAVYYMVFAWQLGGPSHMDTAGWIAMVLGVVFTLSLAAVLVTLLLRRDPDED
jgi:prepilin signal peptidase PulO-like enzyme (type II secretory pathway)